jgi:SAM-dependent methyltransferase
MTDYALLLLPSANRVYADAAVELTVAELEIFDRAVLGDRLDGIGPTTIAGVDYVRFGADELSARDLAFLANASAAYALFAVRDGLLEPIELTRLDRFDDDLITIQKYPGKTNEQFTKLLLNVTLLARANAPSMVDSQLRVLDPLCGRGTTLNQALTYGYDAAGMDLDGKDYQAYATFVRTYLERKRLKHRMEEGPIRRERKVVGRRLTVSLAATRDAYKAGETQTLDVVNADTVRAMEFFKPATFDAVVADAPYGVHHGSTGPKGLRRGPMDLLVEAVPIWARLLRPGGAIGLSWNTHVAKRADAAALLTAAGLRVLDEGPYARLEHRVDQAITRDVLVATKPS